MTAEPQQPSLRHAANRDFLKAPTECGCCSRDLCIITTLFVGCKHGGRSKNVSSNFDPFVIFPDGGRPPHVKNRALEDLHLEGGVESHRYVTPYPPLVPPVLYGGKNCSLSDPFHCPKTVSTKFADVCNQPTPKVHISLQKLLKIDGEAM